MPSVMHYLNTYNHSSFDFIPRQYRDIIKIVLLVPASLVIIFLMMLVVQGM